MPTESKRKLDRLTTATGEFQTDWKKWRKAKFPPESKIFNAEETEKRKKIYKIYGRSGVLALTYEENLGKTKCYCGGKLNVGEKQEMNYGTQEGVLLKCTACAGKYGAISLTQKERKEFKIAFKEDVTGAPTYKDKYVEVEKP